MRWFWIDRFTEFVSGKYAESIKNVSLSEEPVDDYAPGSNYMPASLIVEGLAQTGGLLVGQLSEFKNRVILAKVSKAEFFFEACPGDTLQFRCDITNLQSLGAVVSGHGKVGDRLQCQAELVFAFLRDDRFENVELFEPAAFCRMIRMLKLFDVGRYEDGRPVEVPPHLAQAEKNALSGDPLVS